ncbi:putative Zn(2)-C6 fungal-type domain-containing protein [Seiridium unicorne]|uniref:Zn(2)-C6 fungal-type domain-containing protein n=1 Tax=Seiridium unicorne TaxID=138068 RepID=A0ABR2UUX0_9PEZI
MSSQDEPRRAKVGFKKSRNGCLICRRRRVKCDETRPLCGQCCRLKLDCAWSAKSPSAPTATGAREPHPLPDVSNNASSMELTLDTSRDVGMEIAGGLTEVLGRGPADVASFINALDQQHVDIPESRERRILEHRLMQNFLHRLSNPFPTNPAQEWTDLWSKTVPSLALDNDNLLYALLSSSATHLLRDNPEDAELFAARQNYLILAMREQRKAVSNLTVDKTDAICFTSLTILINSFAMLQERDLSPYSPPMDWIYMGRGAGTLIWASVDAITKPGAASQLSLPIIAFSYPYFGHDQSYWNPEFRKNFTGLLTQTIASGDNWDSETREAYEKTLSYIGSIQKAIDSGEPEYAICRRIQFFSIIVPEKFVQMLGEQRPRALVVIAHFFATVAQVGGVWWLEESPTGAKRTATREIEAIYTVIPVEWHGHMVWPLDKAGLGRADNF